MEDDEILKQLEELGEDSDVDDIMTGNMSSNTSHRRRNEDNTSVRLKCPISDCDWQHEDTIPESQFDPDQWEDLNSQDRNHIKKYHRRLHLRLQNHEKDKYPEKQYIDFQSKVLKHQNSVMISAFIRESTKDINYTAIPSSIVYLISLMYQCSVILIIGDLKVGKTSLLNNYLNIMQFRFTTTPTRFDIIVQQTNTDKLTVFFDISGDEAIFDNSMLEILNKFSLKLMISGLIFVHDINDGESLESIENIWMVKLCETYKNNVLSGAPIVLMGNKCDFVLSDKKLKKELKRKAQEYANESNMIFYQVSAATNVNVRAAFEYIQKQVASIKM